jgi:hypothetical protein
MMKRSRTLSSLESELLSISELYSPKNRLLISKNSWSELSPKNKQKERRKTTGSINLKSIKKKFNLKKIFFDFITTDFDRSFKTNKENMRNASIKLLSYIDKDYQKIFELMRNAVINIIMLILSNGEKQLTLQQVKHNIHFYLKLAEKSSKERDNQTVILIMLALENYNIERLNIKYNKGDQKIIQSLWYRYGSFNNCHKKNMIVLSTYDKNLPDGFIPSAYLISLFSGKNKKIFNKYKILGKYPDDIFDVESKIYMIKRLYFNEQKGNLKLNLNKIYKKNPKTLDFVKKKLKEYNTNDLSIFLFNLSMNIKNVECNKPEFKSREMMNYYRLLYCK